MKNKYPIVIIIADGWTQSLFEECLDEGLLPEISDYLIPRAKFYKNVVSVFPSVSLASHTSLLTSLNPIDHCIPGHRWISKVDDEKRSYIGLGGRQVNKDISSEVKTLFERFPGRKTLSIQSVVNRGADEIINIPTINSEKILKYTADTVSKTPNSMAVVWLPRGDIVGHTFGPRSKAVVNEMKSTSKGIGHFCAKLEQADLLDGSTIVFTSDHGQKPVHHSFNLKKAIYDFGYTCCINRQPNLRYDFALMTNGDATAFLYQIKKEITVDQQISLLEKLVLTNGVDLAFYNYDESSHYIFSQKGTSRIVIRDSDTISYTVESGEDPLSMMPQHSSNILETENVAIDINHKYPDVLYQYLTSRVRNRSADILLTSKPDYHFGLSPRLAWRLGYHRGSHGGPTRDEMIFSALVTGQLSSCEITNPIRSKDLCKSLFVKT